MLFKVTIKGKKEVKPKICKLSGCYTLMMIMMMIIMMMMMLMMIAVNNFKEHVLLCLYLSVIRQLHRI